MPAEFTTPGLKRQAPLDNKERRGDDLIAGFGSSVRKKQRVPITPQAPGYVPVRTLKRPVQPKFEPQPELDPIEPMEPEQEPEQQEPVQGEHSPVDSEDEDIDVSHIGLPSLPSLPSVPVSEPLKSEQFLPSSPARDDSSSLLSPGPSSDQDWKEYEQNIVEFGHTTDTAVHSLATGEDLEFYYTDFSPTNNSILLYGRNMAKTESGEQRNETVCVIVEGLWRELFYLPKQGFSAQDALAELAPQFKRAGLECSVVTKKWVFGKVGSLQVPTETEYVRVQVPFRQQNIADRVSRSTCQHVFGATADLFERFALIHNVKGPSWLRGKNLKALPDNTSYCRHTYSVESKNLEVVQGGSQRAPLDVNMMSVSVQTHYNRAKKINEIVAISMRVFQQVSIETAESAQNLPSQVFTGVRALDGAFPMGFTKKVKEQDLKTIETVNNEKALLNWFLAKVRRYDPDVFLGHQLYDHHFAVLFQRFRDLGVQNWYFLGRRGVRDALPKMWGQKGLKSSEYCPGRFMCDLNGEMARSILGKMSEYSLSAMSKKVLGHARVEMSIDQESDGLLLKALRHNEQDTLLCARLVLELQVLALSRTLTNISGNSWASTLDGSRANRNEFILMHEFTANNYICPDKQRGKNHDETASQSYAGGKVLEPKRGLHKNVLVMDFNSLYPSVMQEYNICFSTIDLSKLPDDFNPSDVSQLPSPPPGGTPLGILPRLLKNLVERRSEVKRQMKNPSLSKTARQQFDIRQIAYKLTANSMYGCLGAKGTRFAGPALAALTTKKGRETLETAQRTAEQDGLNIIYGDTDSIMISTGLDDYDEVLKVGQGFKQRVNRNYRMIELDIDNVFTKMMLINKKKYAALKASKRDGKLVNDLEIKGLDMIRRERPEIVTDVSLKIIDFLFETEDMDEAAAKMREYLTSVHADITANKLPLSKFIIRKKLGKHVSDYKESDRKSLDFIQVAQRRMDAGEEVHRNDVMSFVITECEDGARHTPAEMARTIAEYKKNGLKLDQSYYMSKQVWSAVEHLVEPIKNEVDYVGLAECLQITVHVHVQKSYQPSDRGYVAFETMLPAAKRFADCAPLKLQCACESGFAFRGFQDLTARGAECAQCHTVVGDLALWLQVRQQAVGHIQRYYQGVTECSECKLQTRQLTVMGRNCLSSNGRCPGRVRHVYDSRALYAQLSFFKHIFDLSSPADEKQQVLATHNQGRFDAVRELVQGYLDTNGRRVVNMGSLFGV